MPGLQRLRVTAEVFVGQAGMVNHGRRPRGAGTPSPMTASGEHLHLRPLTSGRCPATVRGAAATAMSCVCPAHSLTIGGIGVRTRIVDLLTCRRWALFGVFGAPSPPACPGSGRDHYY